MFDQVETELERVQFRWLTYGYAMSALGLGILAMDSLLELGFILSFAPGLRKLLVHPVWTIGASSAITALTFLGSYALWLRLPTASWRRYSTLLLLMNSIHVAFWMMDHHSRLGLPDQNFEHGWLRIQISQILNWLEFLCWIRLIQTWNHHDFRYTQATDMEVRFSVYSGYAWFGLIVSFGIAALLTDWEKGWPLGRVQWLSPLDSMMLATFSTMLTLATSFQIMIYCLKATFASERIRKSVAKTNHSDLTQWYQDDWVDDPWGNAGDLSSGL